ncbi:MAG: hypothetical protein VBE63_25380 [Lamprobacter sp.]|nr:hypothetical protein [Lamprobacter sp.]MEA3643241.1 hypothetical protein [Lamprobacter sp.]
MNEGKRCVETLCFDDHRQHGLRIKVALREGVRPTIAYFEGLLSSSAG